MFFKGQKATVATPLRLEEHEKRFKSRDEAIVIAYGQRWI